MTNKWGAELLGTFWLVLGGCGTAVIAGGDVGFVGVALAFGLAVLTAAYAVGHVSGGHFNPAVTVGVTIAGRFAWKDVPGYVAAQLVGATLAAAVILAVVSGQDDFDRSTGFATNGWGEASPGGYGLVAALVIEVVLTAVFLYVILGATDTRAPKGFAPIAIGLALTLVHLVSIPVTNTSVNPARSFSQAVFSGGVALEQLWLFVLAPLVGAAVAGLSYGVLLGRQQAEPASLQESQQG
ncbi:aquaporin Z [Aquipuribacter sp. MA13-6]|uniref:aquaporin Z n=1 Tax=unclassified Aquipuribacter TaxID=2635084 RepID=UPI003EF04384